MKIDPKYFTSNYWFYNESWLISSIGQEIAKYGIIYVILYFFGCLSLASGSIIYFMNRSDIKDREEFEKRKAEAISAWGKNFLEHM